MNFKTNIYDVIIKIGVIQKRYAVHRLKIFYNLELNKLQS